MKPRQKNIALLIGFMVLLYLAYLLSFSKTLVARKQYRSVKQEALLLENSSVNLQRLQQKSNYLDSILTSKRIDTKTSFQSNLLTTINHYADTTGLQIVAFDNPHSIDNQGATILTHSMTFRGSFHKITGLIYSLEQEFKLGKIISVRYLKKRDYRLRKDYLEATVLLQRFES